MTSDELTEVQKDLLKAINDNPNQWLTRKDIARLMGKDTVYPHYRNLLDDLANRGLVDVQKKPIKGIIGFQWEYKAI